MAARKTKEEQRALFELRVADQKQRDAALALAFPFAPPRWSKVGASRAHGDQCEVLVCARCQRCSTDPPVSHECCQLSPDYCYGLQRDYVRYRCDHHGGNMKWIALATAPRCIQLWKNAYFERARNAFLFANEKMGCEGE
jgi:hypothetical protein